MMEVRGRAGGWDGAPVGLRCVGLARALLVRHSTAATPAACTPATHHRSAGAASIVEAYGAILLGFLVQDCGEARAQAAALLPGGSLVPVIDAVERCLHFYVTAGTHVLCACWPQQARRLPMGVTDLGLPSAPA